jgi:hypothetical protein
VESVIPRLLHLKPQQMYYRGGQWCELCLLLFRDGENFRGLREFGIFGVNSLKSGIGDSSSRCVETPAADALR